MKLKEKLKQCYQILFKGRDFEQEYKEKMQEVEELKEKVRTQLEFLVNSEEPAYMTDANSDRNALRVPVYKVRIAPVIGGTPQEYGEQLDVLHLDLQTEGNSYKVSCNYGDLTDKVQFLYERAAHEFAKVLIREKLLRVTTIPHALGYNDVTLIFEAMFYKGGRR